MRIGHFTNGIWKEGGMASYILRTSSAQAEAGHEVVLLDTDAKPEDGPLPEGASYRRVTSMEDLCRQAEQLKLDLVNTHTGLFELPECRVPFVSTVHIHNPYCPSGTRYLSRWKRPCDRAYSIPGCLWGHVVDRCGSVRPRKMVRSFTRVPRQRRVHRQLPSIAVSQFVKDQMVRSGYDADHIYVLHSPAPAVEGDYVPPPAGAPRFLFMGRIVPQKGLAWLLEAFAQIPGPAHLDVAGEGYDRKNMEQLASSLGLQARVTFHGWLRGGQIQKMIRASRAVIFPSVWHEPAGLVTLEAAAAGRPVIASRTGGIPEYADAAYAFLVRPNDRAALAARIQMLAEDRAMADAMGGQGWKIARSQHSIRTFLDRQMDIYRDVLRLRY